MVPVFIQCIFLMTLLLKTFFSLLPYKLHPSRNLVRIYVQRVFLMTLLFKPFAVRCKLRPSWELFLRVLSESS